MDFDAAYAYFKNIAETAHNEWGDIAMMFLLWMILSFGLLLIILVIKDFFKKRYYKTTSKNNLDKSDCLITIASFIISFYICSYLSEYYRLQIKYQDFFRFTIL